MQENDVQLEAMVAMPRLVEEYNTQNGLILTWWNTFPHSTSQGIGDPVSRAYDFLGMTSQRKILIIEFKVRETRSGKARVSKIAQSQLEFLKRLNGNIFPYVVFNLVEQLANAEMTPGIEKSKYVLSNLLAVEASKFSISDSGASYFSDQQKENDTLLERFKMFLAENPSEREYAPLMACLFRCVKPVKPNNLVLLCMSDSSVSAFGWAQLTNLRNSLFKGKGNAFKRAAELYEKIDEELNKCIELRKQKHDINQKLIKIYGCNDSEEIEKLKSDQTATTKQLNSYEQSLSALKTSFREMIVLNSNKGANKRGKKIILKA